MRDEVITVSWQGVVIDIYVQIYSYRISAMSMTCVDSPQCTHKLLNISMVRWGIFSVNLTNHPIVILVESIKL